MMKNLIFTFTSERALGNAVAQFWCLPGFRGVVF